MGYITILQFKSPFLHHFSSVKSPFFTFFRVFFTHSSDSWPSIGRGLQADSHAPRGVEARGVDQQLLHVPCQGCSKYPPDIVTISYNISMTPFRSHASNAALITFHMQELLFERCIIDQAASVGTILWKKVPSKLIFETCTNPYPLSQSALAKDVETAVQSRTG